jgi:DHA2 family multidrug resistance protein
LAFPIARWLSCRFIDARVFIVAFLAYAVASYFCALSDILALFLLAHVLLVLPGASRFRLGRHCCSKNILDRLKSVALGVWGFSTLIPFTIG